MRPTPQHALPSDKCQEAGRDRTHVCTYNINTSIRQETVNDRWANEYCQKQNKVIEVVVL